MGGRRSAAQEAGSREDEDAGAESDHSRVHADQGQRRREVRREGAVGLELLGGEGGRDDHGVGGGEDLRPLESGEVETGGRGDGALAQCARAYVVQALAVQGGGGHQPARHTELERQDPWQGEHGNASHGRIIADHGRAATGPPAQGRTG